MAALAAADSISLTTDLWTNKYTMQGYLGVTAHFAKGTELVSYELSAKSMSEKKTIENLRVALRKVCDEWGITDEKIIGVVTDGGANIKRAVKEEFGYHKHIGCFAHSVNGIGQNVIELHQSKKSAPLPLPSDVESPEDLLDIPENEDEEEDEISDTDTPPDPTNEVRSFLIAVKKIVRFFRMSEVATNELLVLQKEMGGKGLKLIQEVKTRWNSCYEMLERFLLLSDVVSRVLFKLNRDKRATKTVPPAMMTCAQLDAATEMKNLLSPLYKVTQIVSSETHVSLSKIIHLVNYIKQKTEDFLPATRIGKVAKKTLLEETMKNFGSVELVQMYATCTLLDPRFKKVPFKQISCLASAIKSVGKLVQEEMNISRAEESLFLTPSGDAELEPSGDTADCVDDVWSSLDVAVKKCQSDCDGDVAGGIPIELRQYLNRPPVDRKRNPLEVWEGLKSQYPHVYKVARMYVPVMSTSVPSERLFSHAGQVAGVLRTRISPDHLNMRIFLGGLPEVDWS